MPDLKFSELPEAGSLAGNDVLALETAGGASSKISGANLLAGGVGSILVSSTNVSSADLLALNTTAFEVLPAPGGRLYYIIFGFVFHYRFVTTPYNENMRLDLIVGFADDLTELAATGYTWGPLQLNAGTGELFKKTEDYYVSVPITSYGASLVGNYIKSATMLEDKAVLMGIVDFGGGGLPLTGGDSTLTIRTFYSLIDGAP